MNKSDYYAQIGLKVAERAARKVMEQANKENQPLPIWKQDHIEFQVPENPNKKIKKDLPR